MKLNSFKLDSRSGRNPCSEISKICDEIWPKMKKFQFLKSNYLSKSNLNYIESEEYKGITLLT